MDKDFFMNDFEQLLRDKTDELKMYPSESVWTKVYNKLHPGRKWGVIGGSVLMLLFTASLLILRTNNTTVKKEPVKDIPAQPQLTENTREFMAAVNQNDRVSSTIVGNTPVTLTATDDYTLNSNLPAYSYSNNAFIPAQKNSTVLINSDNNSSVNLLSVNQLNNATAQTVYQEENRNKEQINNFTLTKSNSIIQNKEWGLMNHNVYRDAAAFTPFTKTAANTVKSSRFEYQFYFAPSSSYRVLYNDQTNTGLAYAYTSAIQGDVNKAVNHRPAFGFEVGNAVLYSLTSAIKLKAGLQLNYSRYNIRAYSTPYPELTTIRLMGSYNQPQQVLQVESSYKNYGAYYQATTLGSQNVALSVPIGVDVKMLGNNKIGWYVSGTFQPTYILNSRSYVISNDFKNYVQNDELFRKFTMNAGLETFLRFERRNGIGLQVGPQIRYQINSSYTQKYPISEHLVEYGLKVGITKKF